MGMTLNILKKSFFIEKHLQKIIIFAIIEKIESLDKMSKKVFSSILILVFLCLRVAAIELVFSLTPELTFPFLTGGKDKYDVLGYGGMLDTGITLFDVMNVGTTAGFYAVPKKSSSELKEDQSKNVFFVPVGLKLGATAYPFSRISLNAGVSAGFSMAVSDSAMHYQPWYKAEAGAAFRINPQISVGLTASWLDFQYDSWWNNPLMQGLSAGVSVTYRLDTKKSSGSVSAAAECDDNVFPIFYTIYKENALGTIYITNDETAEIKNVHVSLRDVNGYTASELECGKISVLRKHKTEAIPLVVDFSDKIFDFKENGEISAEVVVNYELLGQKRTAVSSIVIPVYNRNQTRWADPAALACYVSASAQEVLEFSKYLVGVARRYLRSGLNRNMQFAMYVFEGMRLAGIKCEEDVTTPYDMHHLDINELDYIQYPYQTMSYKSGDKDDLGILMMSLLQSVGIQSAFICTQDDFIVLFNTEVASSRAGNFFDGTDRVVILDDDKIWIPLSMKALSEGFINSWYNAVEEIMYVNEAEEDYYFVDLSEAWSIYPPASFSSGEAVALETSEKKISDAVETDISRYITAEFGPQIAAVQNRILQEGASPELYNQLGMLYVRAGMYSSAIPVYQLSAKMGSVPAMNNLGNIAALQKKYEEALSWYKKALELEPDNRTANAGLNRIQSELQGD